MSVQPIDIGAVKFKLRFNNTNQEFWIDPPIGWDKMLLELVREDKYARRIKFGEGQEIEFWNRQHIEHGHHLDKLIEYHRNYASNAFVELLLFVDEALLITAKLNYKEAVTDRESYFKVSLIINDLNKVVEDREDIKINVFGNESLDGDSDIEAPTEQVTLQPKKIREIARHLIGNEDGEESNVDWERERTFENTNGDEVIIANPWGFLKMAQNDDAGTYYVDPETNYVDSGPGLAIPANYTSGNLTQIHNYYFEVPTEFNLKVKDVHIKYDGNNVSDPMVKIYLLMAVITYDNADHDNIIDAHYEILSETTGKEALINTEWSGLIPKFSRIIFEVRALVVFRNGRKWSQLTINKESEIQGETIGIYPASKARMTRLIHAGKKILSNYSNGAAVITAPRYFAGGEFWWYYITNGYFIRGFDGSSYDLSFKDWKEFIQNAFNSDVQINGNDVFIGKQEDFYIDKEIARLPFKPNVDSFEILFNQELILNSLNIGFEKYEDDEAETMDAFHTQSEWFVPNSEKGKLDIKIPFTADGYSIEYARREGIDAEPTTAKSKDDDTYIVDCFVKEIHLPPPLNFTIYILQNRQDQGFTTVEGIFSPETAYNLRLSLKRLLVDHYPHRISEICQKLNNGIPTFFTVFGKNTFFKANGELLTAGNGTIPTSTNALKDNAEIIRGHLKQPIISPEIYNFQLSMRIKFNQLLKIYNGIINDRGYITLYTDDTEIKLYPFEMSYDWQKELLSIKAEKKYLQ